MKKILPFLLVAVLFVGCGGVPGDYYVDYLEDSSVEEPSTEIEVSPEDEVIEESPLPVPAPILADTEITEPEIEAPDLVEVDEPVSEVINELPVYAELNLPFGKYSNGSSVLEVRETSLVLDAAEYYCLSKVKTTRNQVLYLFQNGDDLYTFNLRSADPVLYVRACLGSDNYRESLLDLNLLGDSKEFKRVTSGSVLETPSEEVNLTLELHFANNIGTPYCVTVLRNSTGSTWTVMGVGPSFELATKSISETEIVLRSSNRTWVKIKKLSGYFQVFTSLLSNGTDFWYQIDATDQQLWKTWQSNFQTLSRELKK